MNIIISLLILSAIVFPMALYKRSKSLKFRLIKTSYAYDQSSYTPQVRLDGTWYYILQVKDSFGMEVEISTDINKQLLDPFDCTHLIEQFKSAGNFTIPSNRKLSNNEKSITVE